MQYHHIRVTRVIVVIALLLIVALTSWNYLRRASRLKALKHTIPELLPQNVENSTVGFNYTKIESGRTVYSIKAWRNLGLKGNKNLLEDVEVLVYGRDGDRYDRIHSARADYSQDSGTIQFEGDVSILLSSKNQEVRATRLAETDPSKAYLNKTLVKTSKVLYSQRENRVETAAPVQFTFNDLSGSALGMKYDASKDRLSLLQDVHVKLDRGQGAPPVEITSGSLSFEKAAHQIAFGSPVHLSHGDDSLDAMDLVIHLGSDNRVETAEARGNPSVKTQAPNAQSDLTANVITAKLGGEAKSLDQIVAEGNVHSESRSLTSTTELNAQRLTTLFTGSRNEPHQLIAENDVVLKIIPAGGKEARSTAPSPPGAPALSLSNTTETEILHSARVEITLRAGGREFEGLITPVPGILELIPTQPTLDRKVVAGDRFDATFSGQRNTLDSFRATGHVTVDLEPRSPLPSSTHRKTQSDALVARFDPASGLLTSIDQTGGFRFVETGLSSQPASRNATLLRQATATRAHYTAAERVTLLQGDPEVWDSTAKTTARTMTMDEQSDKLTAEGNVLTIYQDRKSTSAPFSNTNSPVFISAHRLVARSREHTALYSGNARMWQDDDVVKGDEIHLDQTAKTMVASHHVMSTFLTEESGKGKKDFVSVTADELQYDDSKQRAHYQDHVVMKGEMGTLGAPTLDIFFVEKPKPHEGRVDRAIAQGGVLIEQPQRRATSERAEFFPRENRVLLSGNHPTIVDAVKGASTGRELTFFTRDDRILIDGDNQALATTQHKVARQ
ncbi:MAG: LPS export ABC transporter periplasmic protein LptC [Acidobacteriia bacterium]|nr:LPS export ABC transporter periplasmic protein LptC [Terriglobia bacterium]